MGKVVLWLLAALIAVILIDGIIQTFGWWSLLIPVGLGATGVSAWVVSDRKQKAFNLKRHVAELEAAQGFPMPTDGVCRKCGKPVFSHDQFCSYCREPINPFTRICPSCATRNANDAKWCSHCGVSLEPSSAPVAQ